MKPIIVIDREAADVTAIKALEDEGYLVVQVKAGSRVVFYESQSPPAPITLKRRSA